MSRIKHYLEPQELSNLHQRWALSKVEMMPLIESDIKNNFILNPGECICCIRGEQTQKH